MNSADGTIHFNLSFSQNSVYLRVRSRERYVNPQLLKQLAVHKIKELLIYMIRSSFFIAQVHILEFFLTLFRLPFQPNTNHNLSED